MQCCYKRKFLIPLFRYSGFYCVPSDLEFLKLITLDRIANVIPAVSEMANVHILLGSDYPWCMVMFVK